MTMTTDSSIDTKQEEEEEGKEHNNDHSTIKNNVEGRCGYCEGGDGDSDSVDVDSPTAASDHSSSKRQITFNVEVLPAWLQARIPTIASTSSLHMIPKNEDSDSSGTDSDPFDFRRRENRQQFDSQKEQRHQCLPETSVETAGGGRSIDRMSSYLKSSPNHFRPQSLATSSKPRDSMNQEHDQCSVCMYTGVAVSTALSLYFAKLAVEEQQDQHQQIHGREQQKSTAPPKQRQPKLFFPSLEKNNPVNIFFMKLEQQSRAKAHSGKTTNIRFFWACSVGWAIIGGYRLYLG